MCPIVIDAPCEPVESLVREVGPIFVFRRDNWVEDPEVTCSHLYTAIKQQFGTVPVILASASFGGFSALRLASSHLEAIAGLVLVDPSFPTQSERAVAILDRAEPSNSEPAEVFREYLGANAPAWWKTGCASVTPLPSLANLPTIILAAAKPEVKGTLQPSTYAELVNDRISQLRSYANLSTRGELRVVPNVGHGIVAEAPDAVASAILDLAAKV